jgi:uncharacterized Zn ribbon protein
MANRKFKDCHQGDTLYLLDLNNNLSIKEVVLERKSKWYHRASYTMVFKGGIRVSDCIDGRSRNKNLFTTLKEATEFKESIDNGKYKPFFAAKKGDFIYIVIDGSDEVKKTVITQNGEYLRFILGKERTIYMGSYELENKVSSYCYVEGSKHISYKVFLSEADAEKNIKETDKRQKKNATMKYIKSLENHDGKPLILKDNAGNDLHYGDTVVYIRRIGWSNSPELRIGKIVGETKAKINVLDEEEKANGKPNRYGTAAVETCGEHLVDVRSVMLHKLAEVNTKSGFVFTK